MTDLSTQQQSLSFPTSPARGLRILAKFLKHLLRSRRPSQIDTCYASEHILKDIGMCRSYDVPPSQSHSRIW
ncbi:MAG: hypothetical protein P8N72_10215 [Flavimaricola sp.]|nr:hypothetical protein [Flavimaricola sp.]